MHTCVTKILVSLSLILKDPQHLLSRKLQIVNKMRNTEGERKEARKENRRTVFKSSKEESHTTTLDGFVSYEFHYSMNGISSKVSQIVKQIFDIYIILKELSDDFCKRCLIDDSYILLART